MHIVVEVIPLLLHASLVFFFSGLVAFLIPVNRTMTIIASVLLGVVVAVYSVLTLLPLIHMDSPYHTPFSGAFWQAKKLLQRLWRRCQTNDESINSEQMVDETIVEAMSRMAMQSSEERTTRDYRALVWTMKSLTYDVELEPFLEAIPDILWGPQGRRHFTHDMHILQLARNTEIHLPLRIKELLDSCATGLLSLDAIRRRQIICLKAFWAIGGLAQISQASHLAVDFAPILGLHSFQRIKHQSSEIASYFISARACMKWSTYCGVRLLLLGLHEDLAACTAAGTRLYLNLPSISSLIDQHCRTFGTLEIQLLSSGASLLGDIFDASAIQKLHQKVDLALRLIPYAILFEWLAEADPDSYRWVETRRILMIDGDRTVGFPEYQNILENRMQSALRRFAARRTDTDARTTSAVIELLSFWKADDSVSLPACVILFLKSNSASIADYTAVGKFRAAGIVGHLWSSFPTTLFIGPSLNEQLLVSPAEVLTALWALASIPVNLWDTQASLIHQETVLNALENLRFSKFPISTSIAALVKWRMLQYISLLVEDPRLFHEEDVRTAIRRMFPQNLQSYGTVEDDPFLRLHCSVLAQQTSVAIFTEFLEHCSSGSIPDKAVETVEHIQPLCSWLSEENPLQSQQLRLANNILAIYSAGKTVDSELMKKFVTLHCWDVYDPEAHRSEKLPWLGNPEARQKICVAFRNYTETLTTTGSSPNILPRLRRILDELQRQHA